MLSLPKFEEAKIETDDTRFYSTPCRDGKSVIFRIELRVVPIGGSERIGNYPS